MLNTYNLSNWMNLNQLKNHLFSGVTILSLCLLLSISIFAAIQHKHLDYYVFAWHNCSNLPTNIDKLSCTIEFNLCALESGIDACHESIDQDNGSSEPEPSEKDMPGADPEVPPPFETTLDPKVALEESKKFLKGSLSFSPEKFFGSLGTITAETGAIISGSKSLSILGSLAAIPASLYIGFQMGKLLCSIPWKRTTWRRSLRRIPKDTSRSMVS